MTTQQLFGVLTTVENVPNKVTSAVVGFALALGLLKIIPLTSRLVVYGADDDENLDRRSRDVAALEGHAVRALRDGLNAAGVPRGFIARVNGVRAEFLLRDVGQNARAGDRLLLGRAVPARDRQRHLARNGGGRIVSFGGGGNRVSGSLTVSGEGRTSPSMSTRLST